MDIEIDTREFSLSKAIDKWTTSMESELILEQSARCTKWRNTEKTDQIILMHR